MAHELTSDLIKVNQTLHGYSDGHRLIEGSVKLPPPDARAMLVLSDASGSGSRIPAEGYLTGYPLPESGRYVLARTWAAPERSRPGCVWTHSLLIDFADLARVASAEELLQCFRRPLVKSPLSYHATLDVDPSRPPTPVAGSAMQRAAMWIAALYGKPKVKVTAEREDAADDEIAVAIWMQQWPRLRRAFRFCSFAVEDRSTPSDRFDLQLMSASRASRGRMQDVVSASSVNGGDWMKGLLDDLEAPSRSGLRRFLRDVGADIVNGRAAMAPLMQLFDAIDPSAGADCVAEAVSALKRLGTSQGHLGRAAAARAVMSRSDILDPEIYEFALDQVLTDRHLLGINAALVGDAVLRWRPELLAAKIDAGNPLRQALDAVLPRAEADTLVDILIRLPETIAPVVTARPDVLEQSSLWRNHTVDGAKLLGLTNVDEQRATRIVIAMMQAGRDDLSSVIVDRFGIRPVVRAFSGMDPQNFGVLWPWLRSMARRTDELAECMATGLLTFRPLLMRLATILEPDAVPNSVGTDPWVTAVDASRTTNDVEGEDVLAAYLFSRAMGWRSNSAGRLLFLSVQRLHEAMAADRLSETGWRIAKQRLPAGSIWREWDNCEKLKHAVVDKFVDRDLPPLEFGTVINDGKLWSAYMAQAAESSRGRRYLDRVRRALRGGSEPWWAERAKMIDRKIK